jgi:hypothetical protein
MSFRPTGEDFSDVRPGYNPNGDRSMNRVIVNAIFDNPNNQIT